jgi:3-methyladenine DNA glycosylase AlkD
MLPCRTESKTVKLKMMISNKAQTIYAKISDETKLGDLRIIAKEIKKDHELANELWHSDKLVLKLLAMLIMDPKKLNAAFVDNLMNDIQKYHLKERLQLTDWLMANQLTKEKKLIELMQSWKNNPLPLKRRIFWYYQGRLRWTGQKPPENTKELLYTIEEQMLTEEPEVQWAMNFTAGWIGIFDQNYRIQCIAIGEKLGLYKDEIVAKNCSPNYLPRFIELEVKKRKL